MQTTKALFDFQKDQTTDKTEQMQKRRRYCRALQEQKIKKILDRERDRLYLQDKQIATSKKIFESLSL